MADCVGTQLKFNSNNITSQKCMIQFVVMTNYIKKQFYCSKENIIFEILRLLSLFSVTKIKFKIYRQHVIYQHA